ncbi:MAG: hypothetical protein IJT03_06215 [Clostridia bacterium]|nr:hypothetical protein [Clostridia bacterium]
MTHIKRLSKLAAVILAAVIVGGLINFALVPVMYEHWAQHDRNGYSDRIDTLIVGDSLTMYSVQPSLLDKNAKCFSFNSATAAQFLDESYYLIKDFIAREHIKTVYLGLDYYRFYNVEANDENGLSDIILKRLNDPGVKAEYLREKFKPDDIFDLLFRSRVYSDKITQAASNVKTKLSYEYRHYLPLNEESSYYDRGFVLTYRNEPETEEHDIDLANLRTAEFDMLKKTVELCAANGVKLNVFHTPMKYARMDSIKNYGVFLNAMLEMSESCGFRYCDFNYYRGRGGLSDDTCFINSSHLNGRGSEIFMDWFCKAFTASDEECGGLFDYPTG